MKTRISTMLCILSTQLVLMAFSGLAQGQSAHIEDNSLILPIVTAGDRAFRIEFSLNPSTTPLQINLTSAVELASPDSIDITDANVFAGTTLSIPNISVEGVSFRADFTLLSESPLVFQLADVAANNAQVPGDTPNTCTRPAPDLSHGPNFPAVVSGFSIDPSKIQDGGPAPDGIPPLTNPQFTQNFELNGIFPDSLVVGVKVGDDIRAYPHNVLDWHEVVNDTFTVDDQQQQMTLSYCPLTGSAVLWEGFAQSANKTFGTSGLLLNSNLVMYDRETNSLWSQMLEQSISGSKVLDIPERVQVVETTWETWRTMYPETILMTENTGFSRPYNVYPYGSFRTDQALLFNVDNMNDLRLHRKARVLGINVGNNSKVYPVSDFGDSVSLIHDQVGGMDVIAAGSTTQNFAVLFNRQLEDCTTLDFTPVQNQLPIIMTDNEGTQWDVFGSAVSGPRAGTKLEKTNSYIAYWFAWTAFFPGTEIN
ncbi:MAG: DUF3179 domain-containing protein [Pseudohongiellaceae bacterium]